MIPIIRALGVTLVLMAINLIAYMIYLSMFYESIFANKPMKSKSYIKKFSAVGRHAGIMALMGGVGMMIFVLIANMYSVGSAIDKMDES